MVLGQHLKRCTDGRKGGGAGGIGDEVRPAQVEHIGHAARYDVGQFPWHRVFGDGRELGIHACMPLLHDRLACAGRQPGELGRGLQHVHELREDDAVLRDVVLLTTHGRAQDDADVFRIKGATGIAIVGQRLIGDGHCPLLAFVHHGRYFGRNAVLFPIKLKALHPAADLGIAFVGRRRIRVVIIGNAPAVGWSLINAISFVDYIVPECGGVGRIGENRADTYYRKDLV